MGTAAHIGEEGGAHTGGGAHMEEGGVKKECPLKREGVGPTHTEERENNDFVAVGVRDREPLSD